MTIWTVTYRKILGDKSWEVEDHASALFSTYEKAVDYVKRFLGNRAKMTDDGCGFYEVWENTIGCPDRQMIVEERTVDTQ